MNKGIGLFAGLTALFAMGSAQAGGLPRGPKTWCSRDINDATGHLFEVYKADGISWADAADCAAATTRRRTRSRCGHLATITSSSENQWVIDELLTPVAGCGLRRTSAKSGLGGWIPGCGLGEPGDGWRWVNSEGPFSGANGNPDYTNWAASEPNNSGGIENHLTVGRYPDNLYGWNDEGAALELDRWLHRRVRRAAYGPVHRRRHYRGLQDHRRSDAGLPDGIVHDGDTIKFTAYEFTIRASASPDKCTTPGSR